MLAHSRSSLSGEQVQIPASATAPAENPVPKDAARGLTYDLSALPDTKRSKKANRNAENSDRQTISEVLHDIYDKNAS